MRRISREQALLQYPGVHSMEDPFGPTDIDEIFTVDALTETYFGMAIVSRNLSPSSSNRLYNHYSSRMSAVRERPRSEDHTSYNTYFLQ